MAVRRKGIVGSAWVGVVLALLVVGCAGQRAVNTGPIAVDHDASSGTANGLFFDMPPVDDRLNVAGGDSEDWRYIIVPRSGRLSVTLNLDNREMPGMWYLYDSAGRVVHSQAFNPSEGYYELTHFPVQAGQYHFRITATRGASVYTVGASFDADPEPERQVVEVEPEPEPEPDPEPRRSGRRSSGSSERTTTTTKSTKTEKPASADAGTTTKGNTRVVGTITLVTMKDDGSADINIRGVGSSNGVRTGMVGSVEGTSFKLRTTDCKVTRCSAVIEGGASARELRQNSSVVFMVP